MVYDAADGYLLLFDGWGSNGFVNETWTFAGGSWTQIHPAVAPPSKSSAMMTYDYRDGYVLLLGGITYPFTNANDTWSFAHGKWTQLAPATSPPPVVDGTMVYDSHDGYVVLFCGSCQTSRGSTETWTYSGGNWTLHSPRASPGFRTSYSMAYDSASGRVILFGGLDARYRPLNDTWSYSGGSWSKLSAPAGPSARFGSMMADDVASHDLVLFGGSTKVSGGNNPGSVNSGESWTFHNGSWQQLHPVRGPSGRTLGVFAYDPPSHRLVLFGGAYSNATTHQGSKLDDTWLFAGGLWRELSVGTSPPPARFGASFVYDASDGYDLLFGGCPNPGCSGTVLGDTWAFEHGGWVDLTPDLAASPPPRAFAQTAYDPLDHEVVLFGGLSHVSPTTVTVLNDTWTYARGNWTPLAGRSTGPSARYQGGMTFDAADHYLVMFGGTSARHAGAVPRNDTWKFVHQNWTDLSPRVLGRPPPSSQFAMSYDPAQAQVVLFGGCTVSVCPSHQLWVYHQLHWNNLTATVGAGPSPRIEPGLAFDSARAALVLFSGENSTTGPALNDTWTYAGGSWSPSPTPAAPPVRSAPAFVRDARLGALILFGGAGTNGAALDDSWIFR